ncbi:hypothetical protein [Aeoliella sp.]|uniref:hypothetical protein n=1 Tax=Aeoliella sp. TaxID=2795800 RepID=UPI003CCBF4F4
MSDSEYFSAADHELNARMARGELHRYDWGVERIKRENDTLDAREWLEAAGEDYGVIYELSHEESLDAVEECYRRGAVLVEAMGHLPEDPADNSVDMLLITLPSDKASRELLFELEELIAGMSGYQLSVDEGQNYLLLLFK